MSRGPDPPSMDTPGGDDGEELGIGADDDRVRVDDGAEQSARPQRLARRVRDRLREREETLAVAESTAGGLVSAQVTAVQGASDAFDRGVVAYGYDTKRTTLGVRRETLDEHGAVSAPVAREMARGIRDAADVTWGLAETGIAGPSGGTDETPVGTVFIGVAYAAPWESGDSYATVERHAFEGDRRAVREAVARQAVADLLDGVEGRR